MTTLKNWILYGLLFSLPVACAGPATPAPTATPAPLLPTPTRTVPPPTPVPTPTPTPVPISFSSIDMIDETGGWAWAAGTDDSNSLLRTQDGGQTWMDVTPRELMTLNRYGSIALNDQLAWVQFFDAGINTNGLARTTDGGTTWTVQNGSLPFPSANFHFTDPSNGWAETVDVGAGNAYVQVRETHDGGKTWELVPILSPSRDPRLPAGTLHLCNICGDGFYYDPVRVVITYGDLAAAPGGAVRLAVSTDLGETWQNLKLALSTVQYQDDAEH
jgi:hypothetical protein